MPGIPCDQAFICFWLAARSNGYRAVRGRLRASVLVPLTPTLCPQAARGRTGAVPRAVAPAGGERPRRIAAAGDFAHPTLCLRTIGIHFSRDFLGRRVCQANGPDTEYP